jgi:hypothetical protein
MPVGVALGVASVTSAVVGASAAQSAAKTQAAAETSAANTMSQQYQQTRADLLPYNTAGQTAVSNIQGTPAFDFQPTQAQLEATPGYQFSLGQGLNATQNSFAAQGLGSSGNALTGAANYAEGLAGTTYQNQFQNALSTYQTNLAKQQQLATLGEGAAAQTGAFGTQTAANIGQTAVGAANASAAGTVGTAQALTGGIQGASNAYLYNQFFNPSSAGGIYGTGAGGAGAVMGSAGLPGG